MRKMKTFDRTGAERAVSHLGKVILSAVLAAALAAGTAAPVMAESASFDAAIVGAGEVTAGTCGGEGADVRWELEDGVLTISGSGEMDTFYVIRNWSTGEIIESHTAPWENMKDQVKRVVVEEGVTKISGTAFSSMNNLETAVIAGSVKIITRGTFYDDKALKNVELREGIEAIEDNAFYSAGLETLKLPASLKELSADALNGLSGLMEYQIGEGESVFLVRDGVLYTDGYKTLVSFPEARTGSFSVPDGTETIKGSAFTYSNLSEIILPDSVKTLGESCFWYAGFENVVLSSGLESIPDAAFYCNYNLKTIDIKEGTVRIERYAFYGCKNLTVVTVPATVTYIASGAFEPVTELVFAGEELYRAEDGTYFDAIPVTVNGTEYYAAAFQMLETVNIEREKQGLAPLKMERSLLETAMKRASELSVLFAHIRPSGEDCVSANKLMRSENIAVSCSSPESVMGGWMDSPEQRSNILTDGYQSIGIGCVAAGGNMFWVQCFGAGEGTEALKDSYSDRDTAVTVAVKKDSLYYNPAFLFDTLYKGTSSEVYFNFSGLADLRSTGAIIESDNPDVCLVDGDTLKGVRPGKAVVSFYYAGAGELKRSEEIIVHFPDVDDSSSYYYDPVYWAADCGVTTGRGDCFEPKNTCTRAEAVTFLYRLAGEPAVSGASLFSDITNTEAWYYNAVLWAAENGITTGYGKDAEGRDTFQPKVTCSRAMIVTLVKRYAELIGNDYEPADGSTEPFPDVPVDKWYCESVRWAAQNGITTGKGDGKFYPGEGCTRAQIVTFLYRYAA